MVNIVAFPISSLRRKWLFHYQGENFKCCIKIEAFPTPQDCVQFSSVQFSHSLSHVQFFAAPWTAAHQASLSITSSWSLLKLMAIESVMPSNHLICSHVWVERRGIHKTLFHPPHTLMLCWSQEGYSPSTRLKSQSVLRCMSRFHGLYLQGLF